MRDSQGAKRNSGGLNASVSERRTRGRATVSEALSNFLTEQVLSDYTKSITVKREGKYFRVIGYNEPIGGAA